MPSARIRSISSSAARAWMISGSPVSCAASICTRSEACWMARRCRRCSGNRDPSRRSPPSWGAAASPPDRRTDDQRLVGRTPSDGCHRRRRRPDCASAMARTRGRLADLVQIVTIRRTPAARARVDHGRQFAVEIGEIEMAVAVYQRGRVVSWVLGPVGGATSGRAFPPSRRSAKGYP